MTTACSCDSCGTQLCPGDVLCGTCGTECDPDKTRGFNTKHSMNRGETKQLEYSLVDADGSPIDLSADGVKLWFTVKDYLSRADHQATWQGVIGTGIEVLSTGKIRVTLPASATQYLSDGIEKLYYDLKLLDASGRSTIIEKGLFEVSPTTTKAIS